MKNIKEDCQGYSLDGIRIFPDRTEILNQLLLPFIEEWIVTSNYREVIKAIKDMAIRGAPIIGAAGAIAMYLAVLEGVGKQNIFDHLNKAFQEIVNARPTARELAFRTDEVYKVAEQSIICGNDSFSVEETYKVVLKIFREGIDSTEQIIDKGISLFTKKSSILTHCNTGSLAVLGRGTALGIIKEAFKRGLVEMVYTDETRPFLQGSRLTSYELKKEGIPHKIIVDSSAPYLISKGLVDMVIVGADRISSNYDVANKIGTYSLALAAHYHKVPFYVAAPMVTIDQQLKSGEEIIIEERSENEVLFLNEIRIAPERVSALNYSFDITPSTFITAIITEKGIIYPEKNNLNEVNIDYYFGVFL
ncbi:MAG: Methylthioribose-1-phosphate isomerase [candidate division WS2 bacterium]|nr:Methylthioribose-1-phosphate isomerase [Candidatus Lithacetigena glycinireducens]